ncbi:MAG: dihydrolipoamide acetyltransferase family protein [Planctomycetota bacterium]|jgi:pyruvate dehydrogenase E2 component (dihydrolipoamide acetyltransferase)
MAKEVRLPQLGQTMEEGTIISCTVNVGDEVKKGDVIFEIETDKATLEMESPADGFVKHILAETDQTLGVGEPLMILGDKSEQVPQSFIDSLKAATAPASAAPPATEAPGQAPSAVTEPAKPPAKVKASPRAKKIAKDLGVDLSVVTGTGPAGKITEQDVKEAAAKPSQQLTAADEARLGATIRVNKLQKITAQKMLQSKREIPCYYLNVRVDVTELVDLRAKLNETGDVKVSYNDFIIRAVATGVEKFPLMSGQLAGDAIKLADQINVGLAVSTPKGLIVPVVKDANKKDVKQIAAETQALVEKARNKKLQLTDLEGACITVSNLGGFGVESFIPIVIPGQCSILGLGSITDACVPDNGNIAVRKLISLTLSVDHKVANGAYAGQFLDFVRKQLEDTSTLV